MIDFIYKANEVLSTSVLSEKWSLQKIAEATDTSLPHVLQFLNEGLGRELELISILSLQDLEDALTQLRRQYKHQITEREREKEERTRLASQAFSSLMSKIRILQSEKKWTHVYKTLCYFAGEYEQELPKEQATTLYSELIRMGIRAQINIQECSRWLQKGVATAMSHQTRDGIAEALDFMDAYGEYFLNEDSGKGPLLFGSILAAIEEPAARYELWEEYKTLVNQFYAFHDQKESDR